VATDLGTVDGDGCSQAFAINSRSQVVGQSFACDGSIVHTFLWENGSMVDLNSLIPPDSNLQLVDAQAINERGEIAGDGLPPGCTLDDQCGHAFVLIPCDDDHSAEEGSEEGGQVVTTTIQPSPGPANQRSENLNGIGLTPREIAAPMQARFGWNRNFGARPPR
jgi:probable HAF family extracellular repeat protein